MMSCWGVAACGPVGSRYYYTADETGKAWEKIYDPAFTHNMGFAVAVLPSGRESFSPDAADPIAECIHVYRKTDPDHPVTFHRGETADAEPAIPGWRVSVDWIFS